MKNDNFLVWLKISTIYFFILIVQIVINSFSTNNSLLPNVLLCSSIFIAMLSSEEYKVILVCSVVTFIYDVLFSQYIGITVISLLVIIFLVSAIKIYFNVENIWNLIFTGAICTIVYNCIEWLLNNLANSPYDFLYAIDTMKYQFLANEIFLILLFCLLRKKIIKHHKDRYFR